MHLLRLLHLPPSSALVLTFACLAVNTATAGANAARRTPHEPVAPLLADDGTALPASRHLPAAEAAAGGPAPGWASIAQREQLRRLHPQRVVRLHATAGAVLPKLNSDAWVFVEGRAEYAVALARRLSAAGVAHVWVMLPVAPGLATSPEHAARGELE